MTKQVPAVNHAFRILDTFKQGYVEYGVSELSRRLDINKSTVHNIIQTLCAHQVLERNESTRKYRLGPGLMEYGYLARANRDVRTVAKPALNDLLLKTGHSILLGIFENDGITIIDKAEPASEIAVTASIGQRLPFCVGSFGRAFLAWMDAEEVNRLLDTVGLIKFTENSIVDPSEYKKLLKLTRRLGYAVDETEEYLKGVWAVSAPLHGVDGVTAAITVVGFTSRTTEDEKRVYIEATNQAARQISLRMGWTLPNA